MSQLDFYFDYACPWCYLGSMTVRELSAEGVNISYHVWKMPENITPPAPKPEGYKEAGAVRLKELRAERNVRLSSPIQTDTVPALIATKAAERLGAAEAYVKNVFHAHWGSKQDISDRALLIDLAEQSGLDRAAFEAALDDEASRDAFEADLQAAERLEISTIPSYLTNEGKRLLIHHYDDMPSLEQLRELAR
jgi:predicted DsbA family dithiol-disulfide isomerase